MTDNPKPRHVPSPKFQGIREAWEQYREQHADEEERAAAAAVSRAVTGLRRKVADAMKKSGGELDEPSAQALASAIAAMFGWDRAVNAALIGELLPAYVDRQLAAKKPRRRTPAASQSRGLD